MTSLEVSMAKSVKPQYLFLAFFLSFTSKQITKDVSIEIAARPCRSQRLIKVG